MSYSKIKNTIIKLLVLVNFVSLMYWISLIDAIISWQPIMIMCFNTAFLMLVAYANGWFIGTKPWREQEGE